MEAYDEKGELIEGVKSPEEVEEMLETAKTEAQEAADKKVEEQQTAMDDDLKAKDKEIEETKEALKKAEEKETNFSKLRKGKEGADEEVTKLTERLVALEEDTKKIKEDKASGTDKELVESIKATADGDEELEKKIKFYYDKLSGEEDTHARFASAVALATGTTPESVLEGQAVSGAGNQPKVKGEPKKGEISPELKETGKRVLGLNDADYKNAEEAKAELEAQQAKARG